VRRRPADQQQLCIHNCIRDVVPSRNRGKSQQSQGSISGLPIAATQNALGQLFTTESKEEEIFMKTKRLLFISCLAAGAVIASPSFGKPAKKSTGTSQSKKRLQTTQVTGNDRHNQNISPQKSSIRHYGQAHYSGTRSSVGPQYSGTHYYGRTRYYGGGNRYYYTGGSYPYYGYYSGWPYSKWSYGISSGYYPYSYWGGYPYSGYNNYYSYYTPTYGHNASMVATVQRRLGQLGYYHGVVDGVVGPRTRNAIGAFESRNGLVVDGRTSRPLLDTLALG
jgi:Putative peptidoglycan binding domain